HDSNVFDVSSREPTPLAASDIPNRDDRSMRYTANIAAGTGGQGPLQMHLNAQYTEVDYSAIDSLDHGQYAYSGGLEWKPVPAFDASLIASQTRAPLSFADFGGTQTVLQTTTQAELTLRVRPTPRWQIGLTPPGWRNTKTPLQSAQDFKLDEKTYRGTVGFLGAGQLVPGLSATHTRGKNSGIATATRYGEDTVQGTLDYKATGFSTFTFAAGRTQRSTRLIVPATAPQPPATTTSGFTGSIGYRRQLSVKTAFYFNANRSFQQYDASVNPTVSTGFTTGLDWAATPKFSMSVDTSFAWSDIQDLPIAGTISNRSYLVRSYTTNARYQMTQRFSLRTYFTRSMRNSGRTYSDQYNGNVAGLELSAKID
ncbi:MAG: hypothetical protein ABI645_14540, partial [Pseudomonadota bacterium]